MPKEFKLPDLGEGIHEGEVVEVLVAVGDRVEDGTPILIVETDKAETEIPSPINGIVQEIRVQAGDVVNVGDVLMVFALDDEAAVEAATGTTRQPAERRPAAEVPLAEKREAVAQRVPAPAAQRLDEQQIPVPAAPSTRRLARELGVDLRAVPPSGPGGRVTPVDVRAFAEQGQQPPPPRRQRNRPPRDRWSPLRPSPPRRPARPQHLYPCPHWPRSDHCLILRNGGRSNVSHSVRCAGPRPGAWLSPGHRSRTSPTSTKPTSPNWKPFARSTSRK